MGQTAYTNRRVNFVLFNIGDCSLGIGDAILVVQRTEKHKQWIHLVLTSVYSFTALFSAFVVAVLAGRDAVISMTLNGSLFSQRIQNLVCTANSSLSHC